MALASLHFFVQIYFLELGVSAFEVFSSCSSVLLQLSPMKARRCVKHMLEIKNASCNTILYYNFATDKPKALVSEGQNCPDKEHVV